jgi:Trypsin-co-occurring domain 1
MAAVQQLIEEAARLTLANTGTTGAAERKYRTMSCNGRTPKSDPQAVHTGIMRSLPCVVQIPPPRSLVVPSPWQAIAARPRHICKFALLGKGRTVTPQIVTYRVDEVTTVKFEIDPAEGFHPAGPDQVLGWVKEAVTPAVEAAKVVLEKVKETRPDQIELKFGVKASGGANWLVAKAVGEANFEVTLTWSSDAQTREREG